MDTVKRGRLREHSAGELRALLARRRISASEFARRVGWSQPYMARRIDGRVAMDLDDLEVIANALGVKVSDLIGGDGTQTTVPNVRMDDRLAVSVARPRDNRPKGRPSRPVANAATRRPARV